MNVNLKLLQTFLVVAEQNSFCRAAEILNRSQSAISMQVRQLEFQLGASLFRRTTRRVELTGEGELLLGCARKAVSELESGLRQIKEAIDVQRSRVTVGCYPIAAPRLPRILAAFQKDHPGVATQVRELVGTDLLGCIRRQEVDFGIAPRVAVSNRVEFQFQPILSDEICALIPADIDPQPGQGISLARLSRMPTLVLAISPAVRTMTDRIQKIHGITLDIKHEVQQLQVLLAMAAAGLGVAILPRMAIPPTLDSRVRVVPIVDPPLTCHLCLVALRGQKLTPEAAGLTDLVRQLIGEHDAGESLAPLPAAAAGRRERPSVRLSQPA